MDVATSHVAWDPGALGVARALAERLSAVLVYGTLSRLVYDCNRPPEAASAIPERSEIHDIPGNRNLSPQARAQRIRAVYDPFTTTLTACIDQHRETLKVMVTVHSFTPIYHGVRRHVEIGVLHGEEPRFAHAMMTHAPKNTGHKVELNAPYAARDGVTHTLDLHGAAQGLDSVMIEIRNDLIESAAAQTEMAEMLAPWITRTLDAASKAEGAA